MLNNPLSTRGDATKVATALYKYWEEKFPAINNLMTLVNEVGWLASFLNRPVRYHSHYLRTVQDYIKCENVTTSI